MKKWLLMLSLVAAGCGAATDTKTVDTPAVACPELSEPIMATAGQQVRLYITASGFNPKNKECWAALRAAAKTQASVGADKKVKILPAISR